MLNELRTIIKKELKKTTQDMISCANIVESLVKRTFEVLKVNVRPKNY